MTTDQLSLLYGDLQAVVTDDDDKTPRTLQEKFERFDELNPWVYRQLVRMTLDLVERGRRRIGIGMLFEVMRWNWFMTTTDPDSDFKLNNNYRSRYARKLMDEYPELDGIFEVRELKA